MNARKPEERRLYAARIKMQLDEQSRLEDAFERGRLGGKIRTFQEILGLPVIPDEELLTMNFDQLNSLASELLVKLRERQSS